jgi:hypothetical protein
MILIKRRVDMKKFYVSKTVWFNIIMTIVMAIPVIAAATKNLDPNMAVLVDSIAALVTGLGNIILRIWFTDTAIDTPKARAKVVVSPFTEDGRE